MKVTVINEKAIEPKVFTERKARQLVGKVTGSRALDLGITEWEPNQPLATMHQHESEEVMYIISGHGSLFTPDGSVDLPEGFAVFVPPGVPHIMQNIGNAPLKFLWVYALPPKEDEPG